MSVPEDLRQLLVPILSSEVRLSKETLWNFFFAPKRFYHVIVIECSCNEKMREIISQQVVDHACQEFLRSEKIVTIKMKGWSLHFQVAAKVVITNFDEVRYDPQRNALIYGLVGNEMPEIGYASFGEKRCNILLLNTKNQFCKSGKQALDFYKTHGWRFFFGSDGEYILAEDNLFVKKEITLPTLTVTLNMGFKSSSFHTEKQVSEEDFQRVVNVLKALLQ